MEASFVARAGRVCEITSLHPKILQLKDICQTSIIQLKKQSFQYAKSFILETYDIADTTKVKSFFKETLFVKTCTERTKKSFFKETIFLNKYSDEL